MVSVPSSYSWMPLRAQAWMPTLKMPLRFRAETA